jgi:hypothetical protein
MEDRRKYRNKERPHNAFSQMPSMMPMNHDEHPACHGAHAGQIYHSASKDQSLTAKAGTI